MRKKSLFRKKEQAELENKGKSPLSMKGIDYLPPRIS